MKPRKPTTLLASGLVLLALVTGGARASETDDRLAAAVERATSNPRSIEAWTALSAAYLRVAVEKSDINETTTAEWAAGRALELDTLNADALNQLSRVKLAQHRFHDVLPLQHRSITNDKRNPDAWGLLGDAFIQLGDYRAADSCYAVMYHIDPGFLSLVRVARAGFELRDYNEALRYLEHAIDIGPDAGVSNEAMASAHLDLARMLLSRGRWVEALRSVDAAISLVPESVPALSRRAEILRIDGKYRLAAEIYRRIAGRSPDPSIKAQLARVQADMGHRELADSLVREALHEFDDVAKLYPEAVAMERVEVMLEWDVDVDLALHMAYDVTRRRRDIYAYDLLARAYYKAGKFDYAWSCVGLALRNGAQNPRVFYTAAIVAEAAGDTEKCEKYATMVRSINPQYRKIYGAL